LELCVVLRSRELVKVESVKSFWQAPIVTVVLIESAEDVIDLIRVAEKYVHLILRKTLSNVIFAVGPRVSRRGGYRSVPIK
jgi:hypothetical protein